VRCSSPLCVALCNQQGFGCWQLEVSVLRSAVLHPCHAVLCRVCYAVCVCVSCVWFRFGMMCAQMKAFFDATGGHWQKGSLVRGAQGCVTQ